MTVAPSAHSPLEPAVKPPCSRGRCPGRFETDVHGQTSGFTAPAYNCRTTVSVRSFSITAAVAHLLVIATYGGFDQTQIRAAAVPDGLFSRAILQLDEPRRQSN